MKPKRKTSVTKYKKKRKIRGLIIQSWAKNLFISGKTLEIRRKKINIKSEKIYLISKGKIFGKAIFKSCKEYNPFTKLFKSKYEKTDYLRMSKRKILIFDPKFQTNMIYILSISFFVYEKT